MDGRPHSRAYPQIQSHTTIQNKRDKREMNELVLSQQGQSGVLAGHLKTTCFVVLIPV